MVRQPQVVVRRQVDDVAPVEPGACARRALERPRMQQQSLLAQLRELFLQMIEPIPCVSLPAGG